MRLRHGTQRGQAVIETAMVLMILMYMVGGFVSLMLQVQAQQELDTAVALATQATFQVPAGGGGSANAPEIDTFDGTMSFYSNLLNGVSMTCSGNYLSGGLTGTVTCKASGTLLLSKSPVSWANLSNPKLVAQATTRVPAIRQ